MSGDCAELQRGHSQARNWLMGIVAKMTNPYLLGQLKPPSTTIQGFFIVSADGKSFDWMNDSNPAEVKSFLAHGLEWYRRNNSKFTHISVAKLEQDEEFSPRPPVDASLIRTYSRIKPLPAGADKINESVGRDHMWIYSRELLAILRSDAQSANGFPLPASLVRRIARFHLVDNVRGEPDMWRAQDIKSAVFRARLSGSTKDKKTYRFAGTFSQESADHKRGLGGSMTGEFQIDLAKAKLTKWRACSDGIAWGRSQFTPGEPKGRFPFSVAMLECDDEIAHIVPPQAVSYGENYQDPD